MRASELFMPTLKEDPADSEAVSHRLLVRGGFVRRFSAGMYIFLPLGWRVMERVNSIMREEMNAIGGQEVSMPTLPVSYTHLRAHETKANLVCRLLLDTKKKTKS